MTAVSFPDLALIFASVYSHRKACDILTSQCFLEVADEEGRREFVEVRKFQALKFIALS